MRFNYISFNDYDSDLRSMLNFLYSSIYDNSIFYDDLKVKGDKRAYK